LSVFRVAGSELVLTAQVPSGGAELTSVAQHGNLVYVLDAAGSSSVTGFAFFEGQLVPTPDSQQFLSGNGEMVTGSISTSGSAMRRRDWLRLRGFFLSLQLVKTGSEARSLVAWRLNGTYVSAAS
jgi:hypothetical protein